MGKKAQIWVENAVYILVGIIIIAILLSIAYPQIDKIKDKGIVEQTLSAMNVLDDKIIELQQSGEGNVRIVDFKIAKGQLEIDSANEKIRYVLEDTRLKLSEVDKTIEYENKIMITTEKFGGKFKITAEKDYSDDSEENLNGLDITYDNTNELKILYAGTTPYTLILENRGAVGINDPLNIDISQS